MRKLYYLNPDVQYALTRYFVILVIVELALMMGFFYWVNQFANLSPHDISVYIRFTTVFVGVLVLSGWNFWLGVRLSHRFTGPIIQIQRALEQAKMGRYDMRIKLRSNDYLHEIGEAVNTLLEHMAENHLEESHPSNNNSHPNNLVHHHSGN